MHPAYSVWRTPTQCTLITPPKTNREAAYQARAAFRSFRETYFNKNTDTGGPTRLTVHLPLPSPSTVDDFIKIFDEGEWPGGAQQQFRALRPIIEKFLDGYSPTFIGVTAPEDGMGIWSALDGQMTVICGVNNATFSYFAAICGGDYGSRVLQNDHIIIAINPAWTSSDDIGQFWDRELKAKAADLIENPKNTWKALYYLQDTRTPSGATGLLFKPTFDSKWRLYDTWATEPSSPGDLLLECEDMPDRKVVIETLNEARLIGKASGKEPTRGDWWRW